MTRKNAEAAAEELATDEHGKTRKKAEAETRKNTEAAEELLDQSRKRKRRKRRRRRISGRTRKNTEEAEAETRKKQKNYLVRAGSVSDGLQGIEKKYMDGSSNNTNLS